MVYIGARDYDIRVKKAASKVESAIADLMAGEKTEKEVQEIIGREAEKYNVRKKEVEQIARQQWQVESYGYSPGKARQKAPSWFYKSKKIKYKQPKETPARKAVRLMVAEQLIPASKKFKELAKKRRLEEEAKAGREMELARTEYYPIAGGVGRIAVQYRPKKISTIIKEEKPKPEEKEEFKPSGAEIHADYPFIMKTPEGKLDIRVEKIPARLQQLIHTTKSPFKRQFLYFSLAGIRTISGLVKGPFYALSPPTYYETGKALVKGEYFPETGETLRQDPSYLFEMAGEMYSGGKTLEFVGGIIWKHIRRPQKMKVTYMKEPKVEYELKTKETPTIQQLKEQIKFEIGTEIRTTKITKVKPYLRKISTEKTTFGKVKDILAGEEYKFFTKVYGKETSFKTGKFYVDLAGSPKNAIMSIEIPTAKGKPVTKFIEEIRIPKRQPLSAKFYYQPKGTEVMYELEPYRVVKGYLRKPITEPTPFRIGGEAKVTIKTKDYTIAKEQFIEKTIYPKEYQFKVRRGRGILKKTKAEKLELQIADIESTELIASGRLFVKQVFNVKEMRKNFLKGFLKGKKASISLLPEQELLKPQLELSKLRRRPILSSTPIYPPRESLIPSPKVSPLPLSIVLAGGLSIYRSKLFLEQIPSAEIKTKPALKVEQISQLETKTMPILRTRLKTYEEEISIPKPILSISQIPAQEEIEILPPPTKLKEPALEEPTPSPKLPLFFFSPIRKKKKRRTYEAYNVYAIEGKRKIKLNEKPLAKSSAIRLGAEIVDNTPYIKFKIVKTKSKTESYGLDFGFTPNLFKFDVRGNTFIEMKQFRADTWGEQKPKSRKRKKQTNNFLPFF